MAKLRNRYSYLVVSGRVSKHDVTRRRHGVQRVKLDVERQSHGERLLRELDEAMQDHDRRRAASELKDLRSLGMTITIEGEPGFLLRLQSLEQHSRHRCSPRPKWLLLRAQVNKKLSTEQACVWISDEYRAAFRNQLQQFVDVDTPTGKPRNAALVANMARIGALTSEDLWSVDGGRPSSGKRWWEVSLHPSGPAIGIMTVVCEALSLPLADMGLQLEDRCVVWIHAHWEDLVALPLTAAPVAELSEPLLVESVGSDQWGSPAVAFDLDDLGIH